MYEIVPGVKLTLNRITVKAMKGVKKLGLLESKVDTNAIDKVLEIFLDDEKFREFLEIIFVEVGDINLNEVDLGKVAEAYRTFLSQLMIV